MTATMRLLVVEDEQRPTAGCAKGSRPRGIWMARENPFDAIILDVMLPNLAR